MKSDAVLTLMTGSQIYDLDINANGDIDTAEFFDTAIMYSLFGERRASSTEVVEPQLRRGWIGNDDFENGSKLWLFYQERLTRNVLNRIEDEAKNSLQWLVDGGYAVSIDNPVASISNRRVLLTITIRRSRDEVVRKFYDLWELTGRGA